MMALALLGTSAHFISGKTAIIFDEIQGCPQARAAFKSLCLDGRYDVFDRIVSRRCWLWGRARIDTGRL